MGNDVYASLTFAFLIIAMVSTVISICYASMQDRGVIKLFYRSTLENDLKQIDSRKVEKRGIDGYYLNFIADRGIYRACVRTKFISYPTLTIVHVFIVTTDHEDDSSLGYRLDTENNSNENIEVSEESLRELTKKFIKKIYENK